jgi:hypothetical protein
MARLRLAARSFRKALIEAAASGAVSMDRAVYSTVVERMVYG